MEMLNMVGKEVVHIDSVPIEGCVVSKTFSALETTLRARTRPS